MRILYIAMAHDYGDPSRGHSFEETNFRSSLEGMGHDVVPFDFMARAREHGKHQMRADLLATRQPMSSPMSRSSACSQTSSTREDFARYLLRTSGPWESWGAWQPARNFRSEVDPLPVPHAPDFDDYTTEHLQRFPLVLERKGPSGSRPPATFQPWFETENYRVWRREGPKPSVHVALGEGRADGTGRFDCRDAAAQSLLLRARSTGARVRASVRTSPLYLIPGSRARTSAGSRRAALLPKHIRLGPGSVSTVPITVPAGRYRLWTQGEFARGFRYRLGARVIGDVSDDLGPISGWRYVGRAEVGAGDLELTMAGLGRAWWESGSRREDTAGRLAFEPAEQRHRVLSVPGAQARRLCGRQLDWVEL